MKLAYVAVPDLVIQVERRRGRGLRERPLLVVQGGGEGGRALVEAASDEARAVGVLAGMTRRQAEHLCSTALTVLVDLPAYEAAFAALLAAVGGCSPIVQPDRAAYGAELDVGGLELLFGPPPALARELLRRAARAGLRARVGIGPNRLVARLAAGLAVPGQFVVIAPSEARAFLSGLPVERLPLGEESRERLELLGVRRFDQLLRLPRAELARQVGPDALALVRAADADGELLTPYRAVEWLAAEALVDGALETRGQLQEILKPLVERLVAQVRDRYLGASAVRLRLCWAAQTIGTTRVEHGPEAAELGRIERLAQLPAATASPDVLLEAALRLLDDSVAADEALTADTVELALGDLGPLPARQAGLFEGQRVRRAQAARAVEELAARFRGRLRAPAFGAAGRRG